MGEDPVTITLTPPRPAPRRSLRTKTKPNWLSSGEYAMSQVVKLPLPDWGTNVDILKELAIHSQFQGVQDVLCREIIHTLNRDNN